MKKLLLITALAASFTASAKDYNFYQKNIIEGCIGIGDLIPAKAGKADAIKDAYLKVGADGKKPEAVMYNAGFTKGMIVGSAIGSNRATVSIAIDNWNTYRCEELYRELVGHKLHLTCTARVAPESVDNLAMLPCKSYKV